MLCTGNAEMQLLVLITCTCMLSLVFEEIGVGWNDGTRKMLYKYILMHALRQV